MAMTSAYLVQSSLAFFALGMAIISSWVKRSPWIWGSFLIIAFILGYFTKIIDPIALAPIGALFILHALLKGDIKGFARFILVIVTAGISFGLLLRFFPGFHNRKLVDNLVLSPGGAPFSLWLGFNKVFIGLFVLTLGFPLIRNIREFGKMLKIAIPLTLGGLIIMIVFALGSDLILWDPKFLRIFWFFAIENLVFVCIIDEAFWRGFIQNEFFRWFGGKGIFANFGCVLFTSLFFAAAHYQWVASIPFLGLVFIAALIYGSIYQITRALEASIFCHWAFNMTHFLLFTYPVLKSAL